MNQAQFANPSLRLYSHHRALSLSLCPPRTKLVLEHPFWRHPSLRSLALFPFLSLARRPQSHHFPPSKHSVTQFYVGVSTVFRHHLAQGEPNFEFSTAECCVNSTSILGERCMQPFPRIKGHFADSKLYYQVPTKCCTGVSNAILNDAHDFDKSFSKIPVNDELL